MPLSLHALNPLAWLGRNAPRALIVILVMGCTLPGLAGLFRPYVGVSVFVLLGLAFMRMDPERLGAVVRRPRTSLLIIGWTMVAVPVLTLVTLRAVGLDETAPAIFLALMIQSITMPIMAAPSLVAMAGLDSTLALVGLVLGGALMPVSAPLVVGLGGVPLDLPPTTLAISLATTLGASAGGGLLLRRVLGPPRIRRHRETFDGIAVVVMFIFVMAVMGDLGPKTLADPVRVLGLTALAFGTNLGMLALTWVVARPAGERTALVLGVVASQRNMGLVLAAAGAALPETVWLYVAVAQFPIYLAPFILRGAARLVGGPVTLA